MPLLVVVVLFYFSQAGIELCFRSFIAVFCVNSALAMTRAQVRCFAKILPIETTSSSTGQAADVLAIFYVVFSVVRALLIPASTLASSSAILWVSAATLLASTTLLSGWGDTHPALLSLGTALTGAGDAKYF